MTLPELIDSVLTMIHGQFYGDQPARDFQRDRPALLKAITRWGYECEQRGWHFDAKFIAHDLCQLLNEIKRSDAPIGYLPIYLDGAIKRRIGQRAEELNAAAKAISPKIQKMLDGVKPTVVIQKSDTELLAALHRDLKRQRLQRRAETKARPKTKQAQLL